MLKIGGIYTYQEETNTIIIIPLSKNEYIYLPKNQNFKLNNKQINDYIQTYVPIKQIMRYHFAAYTTFSEITSYLRLQYFVNSILILELDMNIENDLDGYLGMLMDENLSKLQTCVIEYYDRWNL